MAGHERFLVSFCNQPDELMCPLALFTGGLTRPALVPLPGLAWQGVAGATGVACDSTHVYVALQRRPARDTAGTPGRCPPPDDGPAATLVILRRDTLEPVGEHRFSLAADVHSMLAAPGLVLAVSTATDAVVALMIRGCEVVDEQVWWRHPDSDGSRDSIHLNSIARHAGQVVVSAFGEPSGGHLGLGVVWRLAPQTGRYPARAAACGPPVLTSLQQPHSLLSHDGRLWLCDSGTGSVRPRSVGRERRWVVSGTR